MSKEYSFDINNVKEKYTLEKVAKQANGSVLLESANSVLLATVTVDEEAIADADFVPLTVQYIEKAYAGNKIPGGFIKREQKPGEFETLTSRIVDRSLRPLFNKSHNYNTVINIIVLSADEQSDLQALALKAASMALYSSNIPVNDIAYGIRVGKIADKIIINPSTLDMQESSLDLFISGKDDEILMIEMMAKATTDTSDNQQIHHMNEIDEQELISIIELAKNNIANATKEYKNTIEKNTNILNLEYKESIINTDIVKIINDKYTQNIQSAILEMASSERSNKLKEIAQDILQNDLQNEDISIKDILKAIESVKKKTIRTKITQQQKRPDNRDYNEIRNIDIETNILPNAHSSCLFTRGQTQSLSVLTIGSEKDSQMYEHINSKQPKYDNFILHYNFPAFSVGEAHPMTPPGRREIGHGNLAKKALTSSIKDISGKTIRIVSEILESNGSSSMATTCASSIALKAANIKTDKLIAGIAMGLVCEDGKNTILSDISGLEDHDGDMDFKICGSKDGITALQMDLKIGGIELSLLKDAFMQAKEGREHILNIMENACKNITFSPLLPIEHSFFVPADKIFAIIGQGGKTIKEIIKDYTVNIDLDRDKGEVKISGQSQEDVKNATDFINKIVQENSNQETKISYNVGDTLKGVVKTITDFGAFISLPSGVDGLLHISKISNEKINKVEDKLSLNETIEVVILSIENRKIALAHKDFNL